jgi:predicted  nucleic acid-binding Zn-ribbon protein
MITCSKCGKVIGPSEKEEIVLTCLSCWALFFDELEETKKDRNC